jgi:NADH:ubiquinone oxidoreductase subunit K
MEGLGALAPGADAVLGPVFGAERVAAAEAAIGLAILVILFRSSDTVSTEDLGQLKG